MLGYFVVGVLCAFGVLSVLWAGFGWVLPRADGCALVCFGMPDEGVLWRVQWLRSLGLLDCPLIVVAEEGERGLPGTEICGREELLARLEWEKNRFDGTGNGDHTGRHQRRGISEL